jgi:hypothetical protein
MEAKRQKIAEEVKKVQEIGTSGDGFFRVSGPEPRRRGYQDTASAATAADTKAQLGLF